MSAQYTALHGDNALYNYGIYSYRITYVNTRYIYYDNLRRAVSVEEGSVALAWYSTIKNDCAVGLYARGNSHISPVHLTNNAIIQEDPVGTVEGAYIG